MDQFEKYYNKALRFLGYRARSEKEMRDSLLKKKAPQEIIERIITKLKAQKFLNDEEFTRLWIDQRTRVNKKSLRIIKLELQRKGIDRDMIATTIDGSGSEVRNDFKRAQDLVEKKAPKYKDLPRQEIYQK